MCRHPHVFLRPDAYELQCSCCSNFNIIIDFHRQFFKLTTRTFASVLWNPYTNFYFFIPTDMKPFLSEIVTDYFSAMFVLFSPIPTPLYTNFLLLEAMQQILPRQRIHGLCHFCFYGIYGPEKG